MNKIINLLGTGYSGSTAMRDLLLEFDRVNRFSPVEKKYYEYYVLSDAYGFLDLYNALCNEWSLLSAHLALKNHISFFHRVSKDPSFYNYYGLGLNSVADIRKIHNEFLEEIGVNKTFYVSRVNFQYLGYFEKTLYRLLKAYRKKNRTIYFAKPSKEVFNTALRNFHSKLFASSLRDTNVLVEKSLPVNLAGLSTLVFDDAFSFVVLRDPRDVLAEIMRKKVFFLSEGSLDDCKLNFYIDWYNAQLGNFKYGEIILNKNLFLVSFEYLVTNYEEVLEELRNIPLELGNHAHKGQFFDPNVSKNNIGIYKDILDNRTIDYLNKAFCLE